MARSYDQQLKDQALAAIALAGREMVYRDLCADGYMSAAAQLRTKHAAAVRAFAGTLVTTVLDARDQGDATDRVAFALEYLLNELA